MNPDQLPTQLDDPDRADRGGRRTTAVIAPVMMVMSLIVGVLVSIARPAAANEIPAGSFDWSAARQLPPLPIVPGGSVPLQDDEIRPLVEVGDELFSTSTRPILEATIAPDPQSGYEFVVYDLSGIGGLNEPVAIAPNHADPTWAPTAGLLQHGRSYAWTVIGVDQEAQEWGTFTVDIQRDLHQGFIPFGPFDVGVSTGEVRTAVPLGPETDDQDLSVSYRSSDPVGRAAGLTPFHTLSDGWVLSGSLLDGPSFYALDSFADGATIVAHALDGTSLRFDRDVDGEYLPPQLDDGKDQPTFMRPVLTVQNDGSFVVVEPDGGVSSFATDGALTTYERPAISGASAKHLRFGWSGGLLREVVDVSTGRTASFAYLGEQPCRPDPGFDTGSPTPALCRIETFSGATVQLLYRQGNLARIVDEGTMVTDLGYNESGDVAQLRAPMSADVIAAGLIPDDADAVWQIGYDDEGRVARIVSPVPSEGSNPLTSEYAYGDGSTNIVASGTHSTSVTFDPVDYRVLTAHSAETDGPLVWTYDDDNELIGYVDERGLQTGWRTNDDGKVVEVWGPAPHDWFATDGTPLDAHLDAMPREQFEYGLGRGVAAVFADGIEPDSPQRAQTLLTSSTLDSLPPGVDPAGGWRMTMLGDITIDLDAETEWRYRVPDSADPNATMLLVSGLLVDVDEIVTLEYDEADVRTIQMSASYGSMEPPTSADPAWFAIEYRAPGGEWRQIDPDDMLGSDLLSSSTWWDVFGPGETPTPVTASYAYADPLLGLVATNSVDGTPVLAHTYQPADPDAGLFAYPLTSTNAAGVTAVTTYYGLAETAVHPITGEVLPQYGGVASITVGDDSTDGYIYDAAGRIVAETVDGHTASAAIYDERGRTARFERYADPTSAYEFRYGAGGDPRNTAVVSTIGDERFESVTTVDLLGRVVAHVDIWGTTTHTTYHHTGEIATETTTTANGDTTTTTHVVDPVTRRLTATSVVSFDGVTRSADITGFDAAGRPTHIAYSSGLSLTIGYDAINGQPATHHWTDGDGNTWSDELITTTQSGRIIAHHLDNPHGSAHYDYTYDPSSGALLEARLTGAGNGPSPTTWSYGLDNGVRTHKTTITDTADTVLTYAYDSNLAPVTLTETTTTADATTSRDIPIMLDGADIVGFDDLSIGYDSDGLLVTAHDGDNFIELTRDASGAPIRETTTAGGMTTTRAFSGPFSLDDQGNVIGEMSMLPGALSTAVVAGGDTTWSIPTITGDMWWQADDSATPTAEARHYSPDGERLTGDAPDPGDPTATLGWRTNQGGDTLPLNTTITLFGARAYIPALGMFTTTDPVPLAGPTPYSYADNDPINLVDPTGESADIWLDIWNSPVVAITLMVVLTVLAIALIVFGGPVGWVLGALIFLLLAGYSSALAYDAHQRGDMVWFWIYLGLAIVFIIVSAVLIVQSIRMHSALAAQIRNLVSPPRAPAPGGPVGAGVGRGAHSAPTGSGGPNLASTGGARTGGAASPSPSPPAPVVARHPGPGPSPHVASSGYGQPGPMNAYRTAMREFYRGQHTLIHSRLVSGGLF